MLIDLHCHTKVHSACSALTPEALVRAARARGVDGVCITEHDALWQQDHIQLVSVGIDIGSSGTQVIFSRLHMRRLGEDLQSRYFVVNRETLYQSPVALTPYLDESRVERRSSNGEGCMLLTSLIGFILVYGLLITATVYLMIKHAKAGPAIAVQPPPDFTPSIVSVPESPEVQP